MKVDKNINLLSSLLKSQKVEREYMGGYDPTAEDLMKRYDKNNS